ncbi:hypothetical protein M0802_001391 [Mischocyttarus mexicanus]|nr:hypothetical protein M0802_001391 [Mischocyttarus mexicanus]
MVQQKIIVKDVRDSVPVSPSGYSKDLPRQSLSMTRRTNATTHRLFLAFGPNDDALSRIWNGKIAMESVRKVYVLNVTFEVKDEKLPGRKEGRKEEMRLVLVQPPKRYTKRQLIERRSDLCFASFTQSTVSDSSNSIFHRMALGNAVTEYLGDR